MTCAGVGPLIVVLLIGVLAGVGIAWLIAAVTGWW